MPRIFDNIEQVLLPALQQTLEMADHADFCVGYFNLRGWKQLDSFVERWSGGDGHCCRLLVGMQRLPQEDLRAALSLIQRDGEMDNQTAMGAHDGTAITEILDRRALRRMAGARSFERGEDYFANGQVGSVAEHEGTITAKVQGTRPYRVKLWGRGTNSNTPARARSGPTGHSASTAWP